MKDIRLFLIIFVFSLLLVIGLGLFDLKHILTTAITFILISIILIVLLTILIRKVK